jgi:hypothetical protein
MGAADAVVVSVTAARSLDNAPLLISQLVVTAMLTESCESLERVLCRAQLPDDVLASVCAQLTEAESTNRFLMAIMGERAATAEMIRLFQHDVRQAIEIANTRSSEEERTELPSRNPGLGWNIVGFFDRDRAFFLRAMATNLAVATLPPPMSLQYTNELESLVNQARKRYCFMSGVTLSSFTRVPMKDASLRASLRVAMTAVAIERWRKGHGDKPPDALSVLVPGLLHSVPTDPFDGQPLRYKRLPQGYVVYSVRPNQRDDDGYEKPPRSQKVSREDRQRFDITFAVER